MATTLDAYGERYSNIRLEREDGVLTMTLHSDGGTLVWTGRAHEDLGSCFTDIADDRENAVLIITGAGDSFLETYEAGGSPVEMTPAMWEHTRLDGVRLLTRLLDIEIPVIGAVNGPATLHAELALLSDVVLCAEHAYFREPHFSHGFVAGDGVHLIWPLLLGVNRARYFMITGRRISASEALQLGLVGEVLGRDELMPRARELAREIARRPPLTRRYTRIALTHELRSLVYRSLGYGLALEGLAATDHWPRPDEFDR